MTQEGVLKYHCKVSTSCFRVLRQGAEDPHPDDTCHAGMRVIGVTTTLDREKMQGEGPDAIRSDIGQISVQDLVTLKRPPADKTQSADTMHEDRVESGQQASTSQNVSS